MTRTHKIILISTSIGLCLDLIILGGLMLILPARMPSQNSADFPKPVGVIKNTQNALLQSNINTFMEAHNSGYASEKEHYACSNILYGYDDKYAYAWIYCSGFVIKSNNELEVGSGFSAPSRFEYQLPHFQIIDFTEVGDFGFEPTLKHLFPQRMYNLAYKQPASEEVDKLDAEMRSRVKRSIQNEHNISHD